MTGARLLRGIYIVWVISNIWGCRASYDDTFIQVSLFWIIALSSYPMFGVSGWAAGARKYRDIAFVYPVLTVLIWIIGKPLFAALRWHEPGIFHRFFVRQFTWKSGIYHGVYLLIYVVGFAVGRVMSRREK